jgi:predicted transcriptional regulator
MVKIASFNKPKTSGNHALEHQITKTLRKNCSIYQKYKPLRKRNMKTLSLKLDDEIFNEAEELTSKMKLARNRYINEAVNIYNQYNKRRLLKKQLLKESKMTMEDSMEVLLEFEKLIDEDKAV